MLWLSARELASHPRRAVLTALATVIGVALISGTLVLGDTAKRTQPIDTDVTQLKDILLLAGCVSLLVGAFVISTTISAVLAQRSQELALLRCVGAAVRQLRRMIRWEALLIGVLASMAGLLGGVVVAAGLRAYVNSRLSTANASLPGYALVVSPRTVIISVVAGVGVTLLSALTPARRASRMSPLAALRNLPTPWRDRTGRVRLAVGITLTTVGVGSVPFAVVSGVGYLLLPGAALILAGVRMAGPAAASPLAKVAGAPLSWLSGQPGVLARSNAVRGPERTAGAAGAVMIGLALVGFLATLLASTRAFLDAEVDRVADITVFAGTTTGGKQASAPLTPDLVSRLAALPTLAAVVPIRSSEATIAGTRDSVIGIDLATYNRVRGLQVTAGSLTNLSRGGLWVIDDVARERGWSVGAPVEVALPGGSRSLTVRAIYRHESYVSSSLPRYVLASQDFDQLRGTPNIGAVLARVRDGIAIADARAEVDRAVAAVQGISVEDKAQIRRDTVGQVSRAGALLLSLAGLASLVGLLGILNAMALAVVDRVREFGLLRAVGMRGRQIRTMVRGEAVIIAVVGAASGLGVGILFGWAAARVFEHSSAPTRFTLPVAWLALVAIVAILAAVLAAALPARSAARVDVLRAIASE